MNHWYVWRIGVDLQQQKWAWSDVQTEQLAVAACVRLNTEDESRGTVQPYTVRSNERSLRRSCSHVVSKFVNFPAKFRFRKQPGGTNHNAEILFSRAWQRHFQKLPLTFWETVCFLLNSMYYTIIELYSRIVWLDCSANLCRLEHQLNVYQSRRYIHGCYKLPFSLWVQPSTADCRSLATSKLNSHNWFTVFGTRGRAWERQSDSYVVN